MKTAFLYSDSRENIHWSNFPWLSPGSGRISKFSTARNTCYLYIYIAPLHDKLQSTMCATGGLLVWTPKFAILNINGNRECEIIIVII